MKELLNIGNGAIVLSEDAGQLKLSLDKSLAVGGGAAAGIIAIEGQGSVILQGKQAVDLAVKLLEAHSPASLVPVEEGARVILDAAISQL